MPKVKKKKVVNGSQELYQGHLWKSSNRAGGEAILGERDWAFGYCSNFPVSPWEGLMFSIAMKKDRDEGARPRIPNDVPPYGVLFSEERM